MDKAILKKFAIESRQDLMQKMDNKIKSFYIDEDFSKSQNGDVYVLSNDKHTLSLTKEQYDKRETLIKRVHELGINQVIEESAYTWFNRIVAIRYMEINDYLPLTKDNQSLGIRVLSSKDNTPDPEILKFTNLTNPDLDINFKKEKYIELKNDNEKFKYILLLICKKLGQVIPQVFDGITDYIDILIPDNLLNDTGFINKIVKEVPESNYNEVEIIGWLYQYYNTEEFNKIYDGDMSNRIIEANNIPAATQLFTPDWVVKYMVENTLGRFWIENDGNEKLIKNWKYFIKYNFEKRSSKELPTEIKCIDPCSGSGHILVYMFEVLYQIYESYGYSKNDIVEQILKNNLYGLDIDERAGQLSVLSLLLKAREYDKNIFSKNIINNLNVMSINQSFNLDNLIDNVGLSEKSSEQCKTLCELFKYGKELGSLIQVEKTDYSQLLSELKNINTILGYEILSRIKPLIKQAKILSTKFDVVVTNPPYMNRLKMSKNLSQFCDKKCHEARNDLSTSFYYEYMNNKLKDDGLLSMVTTVSWMFTKKFDELRQFILERYDFSSIVDFGTELFDGKIGHLPIVSWVNRKSNKVDNSIYAIRLSQFNYNLRDLKEKEFFNKNNVYNISQKSLMKIPGMSMAYWISPNMAKCFENNQSLAEICIPKQGLATADNDRFVRFWYEVYYNKIKFDAKIKKMPQKAK